MGQIPIQQIEMAEPLLDALRPVRSVIYSLNVVRLLSLSRQGETSAAEAETTAAGATAAVATAESQLSLRRGAPENVQTRIKLIKYLRTNQVHQLSNKSYLLQQ
jgi:hypothetical protein